MKQSIVLIFFKRLKKTKDGLRLASIISNFKILGKNVFNIIRLMHLLSKL